jgi:hypothetical protein
MERQRLKMIGPGPIPDGSKHHQKMNAYKYQYQHNWRLFRMRPMSQITYRQFPIRLESRVMDELDRLATKTRVPKTQLARDAMLVMMAKLKSTGAAEHIDEVLSA